MIERREEVHPAEVVVLVDDSASRQRSEEYNGDARSRAAVEALTGRIGEESMRLELARASLDQTLLPALDERFFSPRETKDSVHARRRRVRRGAPDRCRA